ncbi:MAG: KdsC family phosphatase [Nitrospinota bacterium]
MRGDAVPERARRVRLLAMDVDGVLTDGGIYLAEGVELRRFDVKDGAGIVLAQRAGLEVAWLSGRSSPVVAARAADLGVRHLRQGSLDKLPGYLEVVSELGLADAQVAYVGDDVLDVPVLRRVGLAVAVADASPEARRAAHLVTRAAGGRGAVREVVELILKAQGKWEGLLP